MINPTIFLPGAKIILVILFSLLANSLDNLFCIVSEYFKSYIFDGADIKLKNNTHIVNKI